MFMESAEKQYWSEIMELGLLLCDHLALAISGGDRQQIANHMDDLSCWYRSKTGMQLERGGR
jgi:hypothetical protein